MLHNLRNFAEQKQTNLEVFVSTLSFIAEQVHGHARAGGDTNVLSAWQTLTSEIQKRSFTFVRPRSRIGPGDAGDMEVTFSHYVRDRLSEIADAAKARQGFDPQTLELLQNWSSGKPENLAGLVAGMNKISDEVGKHPLPTEGIGANAYMHLSLFEDPPEQGFTLTSQATQRGR